MGRGRGRVFEEGGGRIRRSYRDNDTTRQDTIHIRKATDQPTEPYLPWATSSPAAAPCNASQASPTHSAPAAAVRLLTQTTI